MDINERLENILKKVEKLKQQDQEFKIFGARTHKYLFKNPVLPAVIDEFEKKYDLVLPDDYKLFLLKAGNGGAGPFYGVLPFENALFADVDCPSDKFKIDPATPFPLEEKWNMDFIGENTGDENFEYSDEFLDSYFDPKNVCGTIRVGNAGCGHFIILVVKGREYGHIWSDNRTEKYGVYPFDYYSYKNQERVSFFDWYEGWLDNNLK
jgi:hypothetical protein